jgi:hypothetical protein
MAFDAADAGLAALGPVGLGAIAARKSGLLQGGNSVPQSQAVALDPGTKALVDKQRALAGQSTSEIAQGTMHGAEGAGQAAMMRPEEADMKASALGMANPSDLSKNLAARGQRYYQSDIQRLQNQANMNAGDVQLQRQQRAMQNEMHLNQIHTQAYNSALNNEMAKRKARSQMLGSILGIGGLAAGTAIGGPGGAQAGMGVGQAAGEGAGAMQG